ncbi:unnamed protein product [Rhizophagus irregularis]|nr:unnamed protein product [Rhizophagus irregularis]
MNNSTDESLLFIMNNCYFFKEFIYFPFNQKIHGSTFLNFIFWKIIFFSLVPFASASIVDESYSSHQDVYDALLNALFPVFFVVLFDISKKKIEQSTTVETAVAKNETQDTTQDDTKKSWFTKHNLLPLLDDILYNTVIWVIPLTVSFAYNDLSSIKIFSITNACLHVFCALSVLIKSKKISDSHEGGNVSGVSGYVTVFLIFFPVIVIPVFWVVYITKNSGYDSTSILFLTLFGMTLVLAFFSLAVFLIRSGNLDPNAFIVILMLLAFYVPNILQTLLIMLKWPINFYFVKACIFILILSLTRNVSYFSTENIDDFKDFLSTSTTLTQYMLRYGVELSREKKKE